MTDEYPSEPSTATVPQSPAEAFGRFIELIEKVQRSNGYLFDLDPDSIFVLLQAFLVNSIRDEKYVRDIVGVYCLARLGNSYRSIPVPRTLSFVMRLIGRRTKQRLEQNIIEMIKVLRERENGLRNELQPGRIELHLIPIQYLDTPQGISGPAVHRYRLGLHTLIYATGEDTLQAVAVDLRVEAGDTEVTMEEIVPSPGFSNVGIKQTAGIQAGIQQTNGEKAGMSAEAAGIGAKASVNAETTWSKQYTTIASTAKEQSLARVEQYVISRKFKNRAIWRILAGVGPVDAHATEYKAEFHVPKDEHEITVRIEARVEWTYAGQVPASLTQIVKLPRPKES